MPMISSSRNGGQHAVGPVHLTRDPERDLAGGRCVWATHRLEPMTVSTPTPGWRSAKRSRIAGST